MSEVSGTEHTPSDMFLRQLAEFYQESGATWGSVDLFALGAEDSVERMGDYAAILGLATVNGAPVFDQVVIVWPRGEGGDNVVGRIKTRFGEILKRAPAVAASPDGVERAFRKVQVVTPENLEVESLVELVRTVEPRTALIVAHASLYRVAGLETPVPETATHDVAWAPHVHAFMTQAGPAGTQAQCYVVVDAGEHLPSLREPRDLLLSVDQSAVLSSGDRSDRDDEIGRRLLAKAASGQLGAALDELEANEELTPRQKVLARFQLFGAAGLPHAARAELEANRELVADLSPVAALHVAIRAEKVDADEVAAELLSGAFRELREREHLEEALTLADDLNLTAVVRAVESMLEERFPSSSLLRRYRALRLARKRCFLEASDLAREDSATESRKFAEYWALLARYLDGTGPPTARSLVAEVSERFPDLEGDALRLSIDLLLEEGRWGEALALALGEPKQDGPLRPGRALATLTVIQRISLIYGIVDDNALAYALSRVIETLALQPTDSGLRGRLSRTLEPEVLGLRGIAVMVGVMLSFARLPDDRKDRRLPLQIDDSYPEEAFSELMRRGLEWLSSERVVVLGSRMFPAELLTFPADQAIARLAAMANLLADQLSDTNDRRTLESCLSLAVAIAPLSTAPDEDLTILQTVTIRLANAGWMQYARDLAEQALALTRGNPHRSRQAWICFADVYMRSGNTNEALIGMACALAASPEASWEEVWSDSMVLVRLLRDIGLVEYTRPFLDLARRALEHLGLGARFLSRVETAELQIQLLEYSRIPFPDAEHLQGLLERAVMHLKEVIGIGDELAPAAAVLASALRAAEDDGVAVPEDAAETLEAALARLDPAARKLVEIAAASNPSIDQAVALATQIEPARYAEDIGFDVHRLVLIARRLLTSAAGDATVVVYATEALADQSLIMPRTGGQGTAAERLINSSVGPADAARELSQSGIAVVTLGLASNGLTRVITADGELGPAVTELPNTFSSERLRAWSREYPYGYASAQDVNDFYTSTKGLGITELPERAVIVASTDLQQLPPNLLLLGDELAGRTRRLAAAPSLGWLRAARLNPFNSDGRMAAWIPHNQQEGDRATLAYLAGRLSDTFREHGVALSSDVRPPDDVARADLVVVAAHGGVVEGERFFRVVKDDLDLAIGSSALARSLADVGTVILFVCSGGRIDKHPGANAVVGLVKQLLSRGCRAVVAPPWPLEVNVPPRWLPAFLDAWTDGAAVIDACFEANVAVGHRLGDDPKKCLAMTVYGDPLMTRTPNR